jgi:hypothetical protein
MLKRTIKYTDYNGEERTETFHFNLNKAEVTEMEMRHPGGIDGWLESLVNEKDQNKIVDTFKELVLSSYGEKSPDGKYFVKSPELSAKFSQTEAYVELFMMLATDAVAAAEFFKAVIPPQLAEAPVAPTV